LVARVRLSLPTQTTASEPDWAAAGVANGEIVNVAKAINRPRGPVN